MASGSMGEVTEECGDLKLFGLPRNKYLGTSPWRRTFLQKYHTQYTHTPYLLTASKHHTYHTYHSMKKLGIQRTTGIHSEYCVRPKSIPYLSHHRYSTPEVAVLPWLHTLRITTVYPRIHFIINHHHHHHHHHPH